MDKCKAKLIHDAKFLKLYDLQYPNLPHYYEVSRNPLENLVALKEKEEIKEKLPDAVACIVIFTNDSGEDKLLLMEEFRYPVGQFVLSIPSGLCESKDGDWKEGIQKAAIREIYEETGIQIETDDSLRIISPALFSTPGMSDENVVFVCAVLNNKNISKCNFEHAEKTEMFRNAHLVSLEEAKLILKSSYGNCEKCISIITWLAIVYFVSRMWKS